MVCSCSLNGRSFGGLGSQDVNWKEFSLLLVIFRLCLLPLTGTFASLQFRTGIGLCFSALALRRLVCPPKDGVESSCDIRFELDHVLPFAVSKTLSFRLMPYSCSAQNRRLWKFLLNRLTLRHPLRRLHSLHDGTIFSGVRVPHLRLERT